MLDANAYRALGRKNLALLKARERAEGIVAQASDRVALELFAKLGREHRDPGRAISALQALVDHCALSDSRPFIPLAFAPFHQALAVGNNDANRFGQALGRLLFHCFGGDLAKDFEDPATEFASYVQTEELRFSAAIRHALDTALEIARTTDPHAEDTALRVIAVNEIADRGPRFAAVALAHLVIEAQQRTESERELEAATDFVMNVAPVSAEFLQDILQLAMRGEIDVSQPHHANGLWDTHFCALIHSDAHVRPTRAFFNGAPVTAVTTDHAILRAAAKAGMAEKAVDLGHHCKRLGLDELAQRKGWLKSSM